MNRIVGVLAFIVLLFKSMDVGAFEQAMRALTFDAPGTTIKPAEKRLLDRGVGPVIVDTQADAPITTTVDVGTRYHLWMSEDHFGAGSHSIGISIDKEDRPDTVSQKSKIELNVLRHDERRSDDGTGRSFMLTDQSDGYLGFALKLDDAYEVPLKWVLHFQAYQCCSDKLLQPPLAMVGVPGPYDSRDGIRFFFIKRTDQFYNGNLTYQNGERLRLEDGSDFFTLKKGRWYKFVMYLKPSPQFIVVNDREASIGEIGVWLNDVKLLTERGNWGYSNRIMNGPISRYSLKLGIYRAAQESTQKILLDNIRWGRSFSSVDPN